MTTLNPQSEELEVVLKVRLDCQSLGRGRIEALADIKHTLNGIGCHGSRYSWVVHDTKIEGSA